MTKPFDGGVVETIPSAVSRVSKIVTAVKVYQRPQQRFRRGHGFETITTHYAEIQLIGNDRPCKLRISEETYLKIKDVK